MPSDRRGFSFYGDNAKAYNSREPEVLLAGAAGTGKSLAWLVKILTLCDKYPGARVLIVRKTRESLTESTLVTWERDVLGPQHPVLTKSPTLRRVRPKPERTVETLSTVPDALRGQRGGTS